MPMTHAPGLIADIGGTNARFALTDGTRYYDERVLKCADYGSLTAAAIAYLAGLDHPKISAGAFAVAGPVTGDQVHITNHPWSFSIEETRRTLSLDDLVVMNDFKAVALGVPHLAADQIRAAGPAAKPLPDHPIGIIGPGTGLGIASLVPDGAGGYIAVAGEGGHVTAAAQTQREFDIIDILHKKYRHVSAERVCSGKGLVNLYEAICQLDQKALPPRTAEEISAMAIAGTCPACVEALDIMMAFLGNVAGNLALTLNAFGGIYLAGGICAQLGETFMNSRFRSVFEAKGRYEDYLRGIPTYLILHPFIALVGLSAHVKRG